MTLNRLLLTGWLVVLSQGAHAVPLLGDAENGKRLHDANCSSCHKAMFGGDGSGIFTRPDRRVKSVEGLSRQVEMCNSNLKTGFSADEIKDVTKHLNDAFYKFD